MSASISCKELLDAIRRGESAAPELVRALGEEQPGAFFRDLIEPLADSFDARDAALYGELMSAWIEPAQAAPPVLRSPDTIYVLSRVTLGADIKIASAILDAMKRRFPAARIVFVANRKPAELFAADARIEHLEADYPRTGPVSARVAFADDLRNRLKGPNRIVVDPDSRMTQLGLIPVCEPENYFHFPSRTIGEESGENLSDLTAQWLKTTFDAAGQAYIAMKRVALDDASPRAAMNLGVGDNETKRLGNQFEAGAIRLLGERFSTIWIDRGAGGEEARRVTAAAEASGLRDRIRFWEGSFAGFASIIEQSDLYVGYDSGGQHAAAAAGTPFVSLFAGAPSERFRKRWAPQGCGSGIILATR